MITEISVQELTQSFDSRWSAVSGWRRNPYRVLFPVALLLAWGGLLHWALHSAGLLADYRPVFHAIVQIQGFMICLALGFLMTAIPRRTESAPPSRVELGLAVGLPVLTALSAWAGNLALSQLFWCGLVVTLIVFVARRRPGAGSSRRPPNSFVWIPVALVFGLVGSAMTGSPGFVPEEMFWIHQLGRLLLLQGMFLGLIAGVGGMALPLITRGESPPDATGSARDRLVRFAHLFAALLLVLSFWIEIHRSARLGLGLRAAVTALLIVAATRLWRPPSKPGLHRRLVWLGGWMVPVGYALAAIFPEQRMAGMHVVFIGGFGMMGLSVALHVTLAHGATPGRVSLAPWEVWAFAVSVTLAMLFRSLMEFDSARFFLWLGLAAATFLLGTLFLASTVARAPADTGAPVRGR